MWCSSTRRIDSPPRLDGHDIKLDLGAMRVNIWAFKVASAHPVLVTLIVVGLVAASPFMLVNSTVGAMLAALFYATLSAWLCAVYVTASQTSVQSTAEHASRSGWLFALPGPLMGLAWIVSPGTDFHMGAEALNGVGVVTYLVCAWKTAKALEIAGATSLRSSTNRIFATFALLVWVVPGAWALRGRILSASSRAMSAVECQSGP